MRRMVVSMLVLGLASWLAPFSPASFTVSAGLLTSLSGVTFGQAQDQQPKDAKGDGTQDQAKPKSDQPPDPPRPQLPPAVQQYYERTCYRPVVREREIQEVVYRMVPKEEKFTCTVYVPVVRDVKRTETYFVPVMKPVEYTTTVFVPVTVQEKRLLTECTMVEEVIDVKYTQFVPRVTQQKRLVFYTEIQRSVVEQFVPVCKTVMVQVTDHCGNCIYVPRQVFANEKVMREICVPITKSREVVCDVVVCDAVERIGKKTICKPVFTNREVLVNVVRCEAKSQKVSGTVCEMVAQTREVVCQVTECVPQQQTSIRTVLQCQSEVVTRKVQCVEMVPFTERIPIIVNSCCWPCW